MDDDEPRSCCFDEWASANAKRARKKGTAAGVTAHVLAAIEGAGLEGRSVLDVGCGTGDLALAALARGAARADGFDLGPGAIEEARALARERGLSDRATFSVGDGAETELPPADVVVLNRVVCCYPHIERLLANTLGSARGLFALSAPIDRGPIGAFNRIGTWFANRWYRLRRAKFGSFRVFMHPVAAIDERVRTAGFDLVRRERRGTWDVAVYRRA